LTALSCADLLTLFFTLTTTFTRGFISSSLNLDIELFLKRLERLVFIPTANVFSAMSVCIIVSLTIERFFFIKFPIHSPLYCTRKNARIIITVIFGLILAFRLPMYFFSDAQIQTTFNLTSVQSNFTLQTNISLQSIHQVNLNLTSEQQNVILMTSQKIIVVKKYEEYHKSYFLVSLTLFEIIPFFLLSILNLSIIVLLKYSNRKFDAMNETLSIRFTSANKAGNKSNTGNLSTIFRRH
jgi:hypothetical protein